MSSVDLVRRTDQLVLECLAEDVVEVPVILVAGCADAAGFGTGEQGRTTLVVDEVSDELCTADVGRDQRKCQLRLLRFVRQGGGGSILFAYRLQGEGVVPECFLVFLFDLQTLLLPILTIVLVQAYAIADEVLVGTGGSYDDTVDIGLLIPSVVADAYTGEHAAYRGNT